MCDRAAIKRSTSRQLLCWLLRARLFGQVFDSDIELAEHPSHHRDDFLWGLFVPSRLKGWSGVRRVVMVEAFSCWIEVRKIGRPRARRTCQDRWYRIEWSLRRTAGPPWRSDRRSGRPQPGRGGRSPSAGARSGSRRNAPRGRRAGRRSRGRSRRPLRSWRAGLECLSAPPGVRAHPHARGRLVAHPDSPRSGMQRGADQPLIAAGGQEEQRECGGASQWVDSQ